MGIRRSLIPSLCLALLLGIGFGLVWGFGVVWGYSRVEAAFSEAPTVAMIPNLQVRRDGTPLLATRSNTTYEYRTLDGEEIELSEPPEFQQSAYLHKSAPQTSLRPAEQVFGFNDAGQPANYWYFLFANADPTRGYFVGNNSATNERIGYIGRNGFLDDLPSFDQQFVMRTAAQVVAPFLLRVPANRLPPNPTANLGYAGQAESTIHLFSGDELIEVNLFSRTVKSLANIPAAIAVSQIPRPARPSDPMTTNNANSAPPTYNLCARTNEELVLYLADSGTTKSYILPDEIRDEFLTAYELNNGLMLANVRVVDKLGGTVAQTLFQFDQGGSVIERTENVIRYETGKEWRADEKAMATVAVVPSVAAALAVTVVLAPAFDALKGTRPFGEAVAASIPDAWPAVAVAFCISLVLLWLCRRRQQAYSLPGTGTWMVFILFVGLPGYVGYLLHRRWPTRETCPKCRTLTAVSFEECSSCGAALSEPKRTGIEVFA